MKSLQMNRLSLAVCLSLCAMASAHAGRSVLSFSDIQTTSQNLGEGANVVTSSPTNSYWSDSFQFGYTSETKTETTTEVQVQPTTSSAGLAYVYETKTTKSNWQIRTEWTNDLDVSVLSDGTNQSGGKWIQLTGNVSSLVDGNVNFSLQASGSFTPTMTPFGPSAPILSSFYFGESAPLSLSSATYSNIDAQAYSTYSLAYNAQTSYQLLAGQSRSFIAYVYAPSDVSVNYFDVSARMTAYDVQITPYEQVDVGPKTLASAYTLPPLPVPEPASAGFALLALGIFAGRRLRI